MSPDNGLAGKPGSAPLAGDFPQLELDKVEPDMRQSASGNIGIEGDFTDHKPTTIRPVDCAFAH
jgi:hypothetical protein